MGSTLLTRRLFCEIFILSNLKDSKSIYRSTVSEGSCQVVTLLTHISSSDRRAGCGSLSVAVDVIYDMSRSERTRKLYIYTINTAACKSKTFTVITLQN